MTKKKTKKTTTKTYTQQEVNDLKFKEMTSNDTAMWYLDDIMNLEATVVRQAMEITELKKDIAAAEKEASDRAFYKECFNKEAP